MVIESVRSRLTFSKCYQFCFLLCTVALVTNLFSTWPAATMEYNTRHLQICLSDSLSISTCGCRADRRGFHQKVVAYSLYGNFSDEKTYQRYVEPLVNVIDQVRSYFPGWFVLTL